MIPEVDNLFNRIPQKLQEELAEILMQRGPLRIERIISEGHTTPAGKWYEQEKDEWVLLLSGGASLLFSGEESAVALNPGDHILIPAGCRHRVEQCDPQQKTIWLAVHFDGAD